MQHEAHAHANANSMSARIILAYDKHDCFCVRCNAFCLGTLPRRARRPCKVLQSRDVPLDIPSPTTLVQQHQLQTASPHRALGFI